MYSDLTGGKIKPILPPSLTYWLLGVLRTDTGGSVSICDFLNYSGTIVARILYYTSNESYSFSPSNEVVIRRFGQKISKIEI